MLLRLRRARTTGESVTGQNPAPITVTGTEVIPESELKNGTTPFDVATTAAPATIAGPGLRESEPGGDGRGPRVHERAHHRGAAARKGGAQADVQHQPALVGRRGAGQFGEPHPVLTVL